MTDLSGRVQSLENQMTAVTQNLLQKISLTSASQQNINWNQQFDLIDNTVSIMKGQLQNLQTLYTNLYIRFQSSLNFINGLSGLTGLTGLTGDTIYFSEPKHYGSFYSTGTYLNIYPTGANPFFITSVAFSSGIYIQDETKITFSKSGVYNIQFSAQFKKTDAGDDTVDIWLAKNGSFEPWSNSRIILHGNNSYALPAWNFVVPAVSGDYYQLYWNSPDTHMLMNAYTGLTNPVRPDIPSLILTAVQET
jgi:hypothetical protein